MAPNIWYPRIFNYPKLFSVNKILNSLNLNYFLLELMPKGLRIAGLTQFSSGDK